MTNNDKKNTAENDAVEEKRVTPIRMLKEIKVMLERRYNGKFVIENNAIKMRLSDGSEFRLALGGVE